MATMNSVIEYVDSIKPNVFEETDKYQWIKTVEGLISAEVHGAEEPVVLSVPEDADKELSVPAPYDDVYSLYVCAMIDFHNREYDNYNNTVLMFTERMGQYKNYYIRKHGRGGARNFRNVMG